MYHKHRAYNNTRDSHLTSIPPAFWSSFSFVTQHINIDEQVSTMEWEGDEIPGQVYDDSPPCMGSQPTLTPTIHPPPLHHHALFLPLSCCLSEFYSICDDRVTHHLWLNAFRFVIIVTFQLYVSNAGYLVHNVCQYLDAICIKLHRFCVLFLGVLLET